MIRSGKFLLIPVFLLLSCGSAQAQTYPMVGGTWFAEGNASKPTSIQQNGATLRIINEFGRASRGHFQNGGIVADDWNGLVGTLEGVGGSAHINWANHTSWQRTAVAPPPSFPNVGGTWYREGDASQPTSIQQDGGTLRVVNEAGQASRGHFQNSAIVADDWNGLVGTLVNGNTRINWANNTSWQRSTVPQSYPNVGGTWYREGNTSKAASIGQQGGALRLVNESGQASRAHFQNGAIVADDWNGLVGTLANGNKRINWANNTSWQR